ncbi:MAG: ABC-F family ATP-binding cassette domain-containing protein [candidate division FCPU426 bacterium]
MPLITLKNTSKFFGAQDILRDANWSIEEGRRIGLIGPNGAGKTTIFRLLLGEEEPTSGSISRSKGLTLGHLSQHPVFKEGHTLHQEMLTAKPHMLEIEEGMKKAEHDMSDPVVAADPARMEKVLERYADLQGHFTALDGYAYEARVESVLEGMRFAKSEFDRQVSTLSGGEQTRLMLAKLLVAEPDLLLLDEPTNHLDTMMCEWLEEFLKDYHGSMICISHDRYFLDHVAEEIVELRDARLASYPGNYTEYKALKEEEEEKKAKDFAEQKAYIARTEDFIRRNIAGQNTKQAQGRRKLLSRLERVEGPEKKKRAVSLAIHSKGASGKEVLKVEGLSKAFGARTLFKPFDAVVYRGDRGGLIGPNGSGKSSMIKLLVGKDQASSGQTKLGHGVGLGYYDQLQSSLDPGKTAMEEIWSLLPGEGQQSIRGLGGRFLFSGPDIDKKVSSLSGGEKARLMLCKLMIAGPNFLVMDEPTNHLDIQSREVVETALDEFEGTLLTVSHDRYFLDREVTSIWEIDGDRINFYDGNYSEYLEQKKRQQAEKDSLAAAAPKPKAKPAVVVAAPVDDSRERAKAASQLAKRQEELEKAIAKMEAEKKAMEDEFLDPDLSKRPDKMKLLSERYSKLKDELEASFDKWQELEGRKDAITGA